MWLGGKSAGSVPPRAEGAEPKGIEVDLPQGPSWLLIRVSAVGKTGPPKLVSTFATSKPLSFSAGEASLPTQ